MTPSSPDPENATDSLRTTVVERIAAHLRDEIGRGLLPAGSRLVQGEIAARLGVSGTPVREAFYILRFLGLITWDGRRGVRVVEPSVQDLVEAYTIRAALESAAARQATPRLDEHDIADLEHLLVRMESLAPRDDRLLALNAAFHTRLAEGSGNVRLARLIDAEQTATSVYVAFLGGVEAAGARQSHVEHRAIVAALRTGDAELAAAAMSTHLTARARALEARMTP